MGRDDDTPPGTPAAKARPGEYKRTRTPGRGVSIDYVDVPPSLPPPPIQHRAPTPPPWAQQQPEAVPEEVEPGDITGRIDLALKGKAQLPLKYILGAILGVTTAVGSAWMDLRDGMRERPTRQEMREELRQLKADIRELLDQRLPPRVPGGQ